MQSGDSEGDGKWQEGEGSGAPKSSVALWQRKAAPCLHAVSSDYPSKWAEARNGWRCGAREREKWGPSGALRPLRGPLPASARLHMDADYKQLLTAKQERGQAPLCHPSDKSQQLGEVAGRPRDKGALRAPIGAGQPVQRGLAEETHPRSASRQISRATRAQVGAVSCNRLFRGQVFASEAVSRHDTAGSPFRSCVVPSMPGSSSAL